MEFLREVARLNVSTYSSSSIFSVTRILAKNLTSLRIRKGPDVIFGCQGAPCFEALKRGVMNGGSGGPP